MTRARLLVFLCGVLAACGDDANPRAQDSGAAGSDAAPQACTNNAECDDGLYCNGQERCNDDQRCESEAIDCDDGVICTVDRCSESARACRNEAPDLDGDGHRDLSCRDSAQQPLGDDCDDADPLRFPGNVESCDLDHRDEDCNPATRGGRDRDGDDFEDSACCNRTSDAENAPLSCGDDCDDLRRSVNPLASEACDGLNNDCDDLTDEGVTRPLFVDADRDGHGVADGSPVMACAGAAGLSLFNDDCDDADVTVHGAQVEICDGVNNDCDDATDESPQAVPWYRDMDGDGFGDPTDSVESCDPLVGRSVLDTDCDDGDATVSPRAAERCDGVDNDCRGGADFRVADNDLEDDDQDGVADDACEGGTDCDDRDGNTALGANEICDALDNDCDGATDENAPSTVWYVDSDRDGYGNSRLPASAACFPIPNRSARPGDCDDDEAAVHPNGEEVCDALDNDCDRQVDEDCRVLLDAGRPDAGHPRDGSVSDTDASRAGAGGVGGADGGSQGGSGGSADGGSQGGSGGSGSGDAGIDPLPEIPCDETTPLDGSPGMVSLTVADQEEGIAFCGVLGEKVAIEAARSAGGCATLRVIDIEDNEVLNRFGCGAFYEELIFPSSRPYRVTIAAPTVPQTATIRLWEVPELLPRQVAVDAMPYGQTSAIGQPARFRFEVIAGQRITLSSGGPGCRDMVLRDATGATVESVFVCGNYELAAHTALTTGTYELTSDSTGATVGEHTFTGWVLGPDPVVGGMLDGAAVIPIASPGNNGSTTFTATAGQRISLSAANVGCMTVRVASPTDATVVSDFVCGTWFSDVITLNESGTFALHIDPNGLQTGSSTVNFHLLASDPLVDVVLDGPAVPDAIAKPGNNLTYRFTGSAGARISAIVSGPGCNTVTLWSPGNVSLATQFVCGPWFLEAFTLTSTGQHRITVDPNGGQVGATSAQLYTLASDPILAAAFNGAAVPGNIAKPGNNLTYELMGNGGDRVSLRVFGPGCNTITLFDMNQTHLASDFVCSEWFLEPFVLPSTQTYAVRVDPNGSQVGATQLIGYVLPADPSVAATINGSTVNAVTTVPGQNARFTFNAAMGQQVSVHATSVAGCTNYSLLDPLGNTVFGPTFGCGALSQSMVTIPISGIHTMLIDPSGINVGTFTFNVTSP